MTIENKLITNTESLTNQTGAKPAKQRIATVQTLPVSTKDLFGVLDPVKAAKIEPMALAQVDKADLPAVSAKEISDAFNDLVETINKINTPLTHELNTINKFEGLLKALKATGMTYEQLPQAVKKEQVLNFSIGKFKLNINPKTMDLELTPVKGTINTKELNKEFKGFINNLAILGKDVTGKELQQALKLFEQALKISGLPKNQLDQIFTKEYSANLKDGTYKFKLDPEKMEFGVTQTSKPAEKRVLKDIEPSEKLAKAAASFIPKDDNIASLSQYIKDIIKRSKDAGSEESVKNNSPNLEMINQATTYTLFNHIIAPRIQNLKSPKEITDQFKDPIKVKLMVGREVKNGIAVPVMADFEIEYDSKTNKFKFFQVE